MSTNTREEPLLESNTSGKVEGTGGVDVSASLTEKDRVQILIAEYNTLRAELIAAGNKVYQILSVGSALIVFLISQYPSPMFWQTLAAGAVLISVFSFFNVRDTRSLAARVRSLEDEINRRAGEKLLTWENEHGLYRKRKQESRS